MKWPRILVAALFAHVPPTQVSAFDRVLCTPRIEDNGDVRLFDDLRIGRYQGGKYTATPDAISALDLSASDVNGLFIDAPYRLTARNRNAIVAMTQHDRPAGTLSFDTAITGYGRLKSGSDGNQVFGLFGRADCYALGVCTNEVNAFSFKQDAPDTFPTNRGIGTKQSLPVALTVACGGAYKCSTGVDLGREGETPAQFRYGIGIRKDGVEISGLLVDADGKHGALNALELRSAGQIGSMLLNLQTKGPASPLGLVIQHRDAKDNPTFNLYQSGLIESLGGASFGGPVQASSGLIIPIGTPKSSTSTCTAGAIQADGAYVYFCSATNTWKRSALEGW